MLALAGGLAAAAGCARPPTDVLTVISVDPAVPPLLILQVQVSGAGGQSTSGLRSTGQGDATDRPLPFPFPLQVPVSVDPSFAGPVTIAVDGIDWDTHAVVASGSTTARVVPEHETQAALTLFPERGGGGGDGGDGGDAGISDGGGAD